MVLASILLHRLALDRGTEVQQNLAEFYPGQRHFDQVHTSFWLVATPHTLHSPMTIVFVHRRGTFDAASQKVQFSPPQINVNFLSSSYSLNYGPVGVQD